MIRMTPNGRKIDRLELKESVSPEVAEALRDEC